MPEQYRNDRKQNHGSQRLPRWAGYLLIAADVLRTPLFVLCWVATLVALLLTLPSDSLRVRIAVLGLASLATLAAVTRAVAARASAEGALGAYVARLATSTALGRCLTDMLNRSPDR